MVGSLMLVAKIKIVCLQRELDMF
uniref:Uncharacterized protein n=1 Tax=Rhizophora mucronata TaxID=61149 RepID=A0A2P2NM00_RHIMU